VTGHAPNGNVRALGFAFPRGGNVEMLSHVQRICGERWTTQSVQNSFGYRTVGCSRFWFPWRHFSLQPFKFQQKTESPDKCENSSINKQQTSVAEWVSLQGGMKLVEKYGLPCCLTVYILTTIKIFQHTYTHSSNLFNRQTQHGRTALKMVIFWGKGTQKGSQHFRHR
jgi:hypothetical protein